MQAREMQARERKEAPKAGAAWWHWMASGVLAILFLVSGLTVGQLPAFCVNCNGMYTGSPVDVAVNNLRISDLRFTNNSGGLLLRID